MIVLARVDDRLLHGQVSVGWVPHVRATLVVVANDRIAADPLLSGIVRAGAAGVRVETLTVGEAARRATGAEWAREKVIVLFETLQDARRAIEAGLGVARLNVGGLRHHDGLVCICDGVTLDRDDCAILHELVGRGVQVDVRLMPRDRACALPPVAGGEGR